MRDRLSASSLGGKRLIGHDLLIDIFHGLDLLSHACLGAVGNIRTYPFEDVSPPIRKCSARHPRQAALSLTSTLTRPEGNNT